MPSQIMATEEVWVAIVQPQTKTMADQRRRRQETIIGEVRVDPEGGEATARPTIGHRIGKHRKRGQQQRCQCLIKEHEDGRARITIKDSRWVKIFFFRLLFR